VSTAIALVPDAHIGAPIVDPCRLAEIALAGAVRASVDAVYIEPGSDPEATYALTFERGREVIRRVEVDALSGAAAVARLAYIGGLDLADTATSSAVVPVRSGDCKADVVITIRPGAGLRADLMVVSKQRSKTSVPPPDLGDVVGQYRLMAQLGEGGMGTVYRVQHEVLGREYALKVLRQRVVESASTAAQRFVREARAAARVRHPNIVDVFDFGHFPDGRPYFVMELCEGESLIDLVRRNPLQPAQVVAVARQIATALAAVHDRGVIHADVTPSNVLVVGSSPIHVKLVDFGLAAIAGEVFNEEDSDFVLGTPAYISPEQLHGLAATDRSDQYGLGCVLFELLTGSPPYRHENVRELCMMHIQAPIPQPHSPFGPLPPKLADVITTCLQKSPQQRFPGMRAMLAALDEVERVIDRRGWQKWLNG
jgi:serine/threonine protein kinase